MVKLDTDLSFLKETNTESQLEVLNGIKAKLQNKLNEKTVKQLTKRHEQLSESEKQLLDQVFDLTIEIGALWKHNNIRIHKNIQTNYTNNNEKI